MATEQHRNPPTTTRSLTTGLSATNSLHPHQGHDTPLEVNDLMVAIVAKALRLARVVDVIQANNFFDFDHWQDYRIANAEFYEAVKAYRKTLDGA